MHFCTAEHFPKENVQQRTAEHLTLQKCIFVQHFSKKSKIEQKKENIFVKVYIILNYFYSMATKICCYACSLGPFQMSAGIKDLLRLIGRSPKGPIGT